MPVHGIEYLPIGESRGRRTRRQNDETPISAANRGLVERTSEGCGISPPSSMEGLIRQFTKDAERADFKRERGDAPAYARRGDCWLI